MAAKGEKSLRKWGKNVGDFQNFVGDFPKNVGDFSANVGVFGAWCRRKLSTGGAAVRKSVERCASVWCCFHAHLVQPSCPSGATFTLIWCNLSAHLVLLSCPSGATFAPIWCNLRPKEGRINKPSALGLVGKICIFAATSYRCGAHTIVLSRVPRKVLLTLRGSYSSCDYRWAATTSIYTLP